LTGRPAMRQWCDIGALVGLLSITARRRFSSIRTWSMGGVSRSVPVVRAPEDVNPRLITGEAHVVVVVPDREPACDVGRIRHRVAPRQRVHRRDPRFVPSALIFITIDSMCPRRVRSYRTGTTSSRSARIRPALHRPDGLVAGTDHFNLVRLPANRSPWRRSGRSQLAPARA
jgi:hypothetical protein